MAPSFDSSPVNLRSAKEASTSRCGLSHIARESTSRRDGVALIFVLLTLALIALLVVGFLSMATVERRASDTYSAGVTVRTLSDSTANVVIGQIRQATEQLGSQKTWASQPGAIRTYGTIADSATPGRAKLDHLYKLYSSSAMVVNNTANPKPFDPNAEVPPIDWAQKPSIYTDLNEPVLSSSDPAQTAQLHYPILNPPDTKEIQGFEIDQAPGATLSQPAPMPVEWLYQLKDGTLVAPLPNSGDGRTVNFDSSIVTKTNPIVGRVAFWTDDETAKVNVNTASQGVFWDTPLGNTKMERGAAPDITQDPPATGLGFAASLPARNEFTRYTGHPSRTCLSPILGTWLPLSTPPTPTELDQYYQLTPRIALGGTKGGTVPSISTTLTTLDDDRLYASVDEFAFGTKFSGALKSANAQRLPNNTALTTSTLEKIKFFLTANSRAPEVNLFNRPRFALWPLSQSSQYRNAVDNVIAFASTCNKLPYYFQRSRVDSSGALATNSAGDPTEDYANVQRNQQLYSYLQTLTNNNVPGFGKSFSAKFGADRDQILTEMFDYIRSEVNIVSKGLSPTYVYAMQNTSGQAGEWWSAPLRINSTKGFGRFATVTEAALVFYATDKDTNGVATKVQAFLLLQFFRPMPGIPHIGASMRVKITGLNQFALNGTSLGFPGNATSLQNVLDVYGGWGHSEAYQALLLPLLQSGGAPKTSTKGVPDEAKNYPFVSQEVTLGNGGSNTTMAFTGGPIQIELSTGELGSTGKHIQTINMNFPSSATWPRPRMIDTTLQRGFDSRMAKINGIANSPSGNAGTWSSKLGTAMADYRDYRDTLINSEDVVRSVQANATGPAGGDFRLFAAMDPVPASWFTTHPLYNSSDWLDRGGHSLREERWSLLGQVGYNPRGNTPTTEIASVTSSIPQANRPSSWATAGGLVRGITYAPSCVPAAPRGLNGASRSQSTYLPGDWENGPGIFQDGPYIRNPSLAISNPAEIKTFPGLMCGSLYTYGCYDPDNTGINFTPNRQIASAVQFGALPTGVMRAQPWQTLLFCPNPPSRTTSALSEPTLADHPGFAYPRDHLLLDLFWMPVAQPYAISEPFSTAGKINMNYDILPFRYIKRRTAIDAVLADARVTAIPSMLAKDQTTGKADNYKGLDTCPYDFRYGVDLDPTTGTLRGFEERFKTGDIFRSASEICDIFLVPKLLSGVKYSPAGSNTTSYQNMVQWWASMSLSGDNARENPYNDIYPRLTTKSNTYRVHLRVQTLQKVKQSGTAGTTGSDTGTASWIEGKDQVTGEYRGSFLLERYVDMNDTTLPDFATATDFTKNGVDQYYKFRIVDRKQFAP